MKKKNMIIIGVIALILVVAVGYAIFSDTLNINGSATAQGDFSLSYTCDIDESSSNEDLASCQVEEGNKVTMESTLSKPNDAVIFHVTVTNNGTIPAVLKGVTSPNNKGEDFKSEGDVVYVDTNYSLMAYYAIGEEGQEEQKWGDSVVEGANITLNPGEKIKIGVVHGWVDSDLLGLPSQPELPAEGVTMNYNLTFDFEQATN